MIEAQSGDLFVRGILARHPRVSIVSEGRGSGIRFREGSRHREIRVGQGAEIFGLLELLDNNPIVCADVVSVPDPAQTLALIALGPVAAAGLLFERPAFVTSTSTEQPPIDLALGSAGWREGLDLHVEPQDCGSVLLGTGIAAIPTPDGPGDLPDLYEERYGRSFFVRKAEPSEWAPEAVQGTPWALYTLNLALDQPNSLLTVRVMADLHGKCGAAQVVHAMNVMCGFAETEGIL